MYKKAIFNILFILFGVVLLKVSADHELIQKQHMELMKYEKYQEGENLTDKNSQSTQAISTLNDNKDKSNKSSNEKNKQEDKSNSNSDSMNNSFDDFKDKNKSNSLKKDGIELNSDTTTKPDANSLPEYTALYPDMYVKCTIPDEEDGKKVAYLTFDDGPSNVTGEVLDILKENDIKATFFIIGSSVTQKREDYLKTMIERGYTIGIHTYSHEDDIYKSVESYLDDFYKAFEQIYDITGVKPTIFRFPYGSINAYNRRIKYELIAEMERRGFTYYDWNVSAEDSCGNPSESKIMSNVLNHYKSFCKPVILMHDSAINKKTAKSLPKIIATIKEAGYEFDTLDHRSPCQFYYKK